MLKVVMVELCDERKQLLTMEQQDVSLSWEGKLCKQHTRIALTAFMCRLSL